jgi:hypothetical protein
MEIHIFLGLMIPVAFFAFTGMVKSLVRSNWAWGNFYLGIDIALAAFANAIVNVVDSVHQTESAPNPNLGHKMAFTAICIVLSFAALLITMGLHQRFDVPGDPAQRSNRRMAKGILLGVVGNLAGGGVLGLFIYWKLRRLV